MTDLVSCPSCLQGFLVPPDPCPACGAPAPSPDPGSGAREPDRVVSSRLNETARVGGIMVAGLVTGMLSWFLVSREMGAALLLLALLASATILWRR
jgi:predicted lipid-binding transport protein (Tim44 family)